MLDLVFMYFHHRFNLIDRNFPKLSEKHNTIQPVLKVPDDCLNELSRKGNLKRCYLLALDAIEISRSLPTVRHKNSNPDPNFETAFSFSPAALLHAYQNRTRTALTAIAP